MKLSSTTTISSNYERVKNVHMQSSAANGMAMYVSITSLVL